MRQVALAALAVVLGACATTPRPVVPREPVVLDRLQEWEAHGRIGISGAQGGGSGSFDWQQRSDQSLVQIRGPVGIGSVKLQMSGDASHPSLRLETGDGATLESDAAWSELEARLGADLPAGHLRYWLLGLSAPGEHRWSESTASGETTLEQNGWRIDYQRYTEEPGARVPLRLRAMSGAARVRIVIDRWRLGE